jgi:riboflavin kinase/FMN adenylyltransferase
VEAHALHAEVDLYGRQARVRLLRYLRPERRFSSVEGLTEQIARDRREAEDIEKACHTGKNEVV